MANWLTRAAIVGGGVAATLAFSSPAEAQRWHRYRHYDRGGDVATGALIGGIVGLGLGAAIASSNRDRYYDDYYYGPPPRYYRPYRGYAYRPHYRPYRAYRPCVRRVYDPYLGRRVRVRVC